MELTKLKEPLHISKVDFRIQSINKGGYATILAYKDARVDMERLDNVCGQENWQRDHKEVNDVVYCGIGIKLGDGWVWKWDAGAESYTEKEKGQASDSFKRAGTNWGIGRELYDYPHISIKLNSNEFQVKDGKVYATYELRLKEWTWYSEFKDNKISYLGARDQNGTVRFQWGELKQKQK